MRAFKPLGQQLHVLEALVTLELEAVDLLPQQHRNSNTVTVTP